MKPFLAVLLALVALSSACTGFSAGGPSGELKINSFYFNPNSIVGNQKTFLNLELQNFGTFAAKNVNVVLYGLSSDISIADMLTSNEIAEPKDKPTFINFSIVNPASQSLGSQGEKRSVKWLVSYDGKVLEKQNINQKANVRVCYTYRTEAKGKVTFISDSEYLIQREKGALAEETSVFQSTAGPLQLSVSAPQPVIFGNNVVLHVSVANVGSGFAVGTNGNPCRALDSRGANQANLTVRLKNTQLSCKLSGNTDTMPIFLKHGEGKTETVTCSYDAPKNVPTSTEELEFILNYGYYTDAATAVTIKGV